MGKSKYKSFSWWRSTAVNRADSTAVNRADSTAVNRADSIAVNRADSIAVNRADRMIMVDLRNVPYCQKCVSQ